jgi:hypothetical protein
MHAPQAAPVPSADAHSWCFSAHEAPHVWLGVDDEHAASAARHAASRRNLEETCVSMVVLIAP